MILRLLRPGRSPGSPPRCASRSCCVIQKGETRHWKKQAGQFEQLYHARAGRLRRHGRQLSRRRRAARAADRAAARRVASRQQIINDRSEHALETRLADARARSRACAPQPKAAADPGARRSTPVPGLPAAPAGPAQAAGEDRLPNSDALTATEQAIQLDELVKWVKAQAAVDPDNGKNKSRGDAEKKRDFTQRREVVKFLERPIGRQFLRRVALEPILSLLAPSRLCVKKILLALS